MTSTETRIAQQAADRMTAFYSRYPTMRRGPEAVRSAIYDAALRMIRDDNVAAIDSAALSAAVDAVAATA